MWVDITPPDKLGMIPRKHCLRRFSSSTGQSNLAALVAMILVSRSPIANWNADRHRTRLWLHFLRQIEHGCCPECAGLSPPNCVVLTCSSPAC